jgi:hypothetical protein
MSSLPAHCFSLCCTAVLERGSLLPLGRFGDDRQHSLQRFPAIVSFLVLCDFQAVHTSITQTVLDSDDSSGSTSQRCLAQVTTCSSRASLAAVSWCPVAWYQQACLHCRTEKKAREALSRALAASQREAEENADVTSMQSYLSDAFVDDADFVDKLSMAAEQTVTAEVRSCGNYQCL